MSNLADALFTTTQQRVLGLLYTHPERSYYTKEIIRSTGMGVATIKRELDRMLASDIITLSKVGNQHHYQANKACPIYNELRGIVLKTFGVVDVIRAALEPYDDQISLAFIYGSLAKGADTAKSDIDLLIVGLGLSYSEVLGLLTDAEEKLGRPINPTIYDEAQITKKLKEKNAFLVRVREQPKLWIKGDENDFSAIG